MKHTAYHTVRTYECDAYAHVNNAVYLNYLEYARREFLTACGFDYAAFLAAGYYVFVTRIDIRYKASAHLDDRLGIETESVKLGRLSGTLRQRVLQADGSVCADAEVTWACVTKDGRLHPIPDEFLVPGLSPEGGAEGCGAEG